MNNSTKSKIYLMLFGLLFFTKCITDPMDDYTYRNKQDVGAVQVYLNPDDTGNSLLETIIRIADKKVDTFNFPMNYSHNTLSVFFENCDVFIDDYHGIYIYQRKNGVPGYFLKIIGVLSLKPVGPKLLEAETSIGKAILDFTKTDSVKAINFTFQYSGYPPPISYAVKDTLYHQIVFSYYPPIEWMMYFNCPEKSDKIVYAWRTGKLNKPACFQKQKR